MSKEEVIDYVMTTPSNPNRAVLSGMLDAIVEASSSGGGTLVVHIASRDNPDTESSEFTLYEYDKTGAEIIDALQSNKSVVFAESYENQYISHWFYPTLLEENGTDDEGNVTNWKLQIGAFSYSTRGYVFGLDILQIFIDDGEITNTTGYNTTVSAQ